MASGYRQFLWTCPLCVINRRAAAAQSRGSCCDAAAPSRSDPRIRVVQHRPPMLGLWTRPGDPVGTPPMWSVSTAWMYMRSGPSVGYSDGFRSGIDFRGIRGVVHGCGLRLSAAVESWRGSGACWRRLGGLGRAANTVICIRCRRCANLARDCVGCSVWLVWAAAATLTKAVGA